MLLATTSLVVAVPAGSSDPWWPSKSVTIRVFMTPVKQSLVEDVAPHTVRLLGTFTKGDTVRTTALLRNVVPQFGKPKGANVGTVSAVFVALSPQTVREDSVARLPGGTVHVRGVSTLVPRTRPHLKFAIVRGTGIYAGATGVAERVFPITATDPENIYRLQLP